MPCNTNGVNYAVDAAYMDGAKYAIYEIMKEADVGGSDEIRSSGGTIDMMCGAAAERLIEVLSGKDGFERREGEPYICEHLRPHVGEEFRVYGNIRVWYIGQDGKLHGQANSSDSISDTTKLDILLLALNHPEHIHRLPDFQTPEFSDAEKNTVQYFCECYDIDIGSAVLERNLNGQLVLHGGEQETLLACKLFPQVQLGQTVKLKKILEKD